MFNTPEVEQNNRLAILRKRVESRIKNRPGRFTQEFLESVARMETTREELTPDYWLSEFLFLCEEHAKEEKAELERQLQPV